MTLCCMVSVHPIINSSGKKYYCKNKEYRGIAIKSSRIKWVALPVVGWWAGNSITAHADPKGENWKSTFVGLSRLSYLIGTVALISGDYLFTKYVLDSGDADVVGVKKELKEARDLHEKLSIRRYQSVGSPYEKEYENEVNDSIQRMQKITDRLLELEDLHKESESPFRKVFQRSAIRLHHLCERNGGVYIKLGQHLAQLDYLLPMEFIVVLRRLLNDTPRSPYSAVRKTVLEDCGQYPEELFAEFDPCPIASASLAQVHVAIGHDGTKYAVKVQHEHLKRTATEDMRAVTLVVNVVAKLFKEFSYKWLAREMNSNLPLELNFNQEAQNISKCRDLLYPLIRSGELVLPKVYRSSERVLVMSFEEGWFLDDADKMQASGIDPAEVAHLISKTFCEQIYRHGFVHCDPHTANVLVRVRPGSSTNNPKAQIVLLDHGLYRQLDDKFRRDYCRLWRAIVTSNIKDIEKYCREMNAGDMYPLLSAMLTLRAWDDIVSSDLNRLQNKGTKSESERIRFYAHRYMNQIVDLMENVPSALLLLLKTNDCLRQLDKSVGAPINTMAVVAETTADVIFKEEISRSSDMSTSYHVYLRYIQLESRALLLGLAGSWIRVVEYVNISWLGLWGKSDISRASVSVEQRNK